MAAPHPVTCRHMLGLASAQGPTGPVLTARTAGPAPFVGPYFGCAVLCRSGSIHTLFFSGVNLTTSTCLHTHRGHTPTGGKDMLIVKKTWHPAFIIRPPNHSFQAGSSVQPSIPSAYKRTVLQESFPGFDLGHQPRFPIVRLSKT